jgi:hypothetical protein
LRFVRERPYRRAVFFMDADALLMNMSIPAATLLDQYPTKSFLFGT